MASASINSFSPANASGKSLLINELSGIAGAKMFNKISFEIDSAESNL
ncbi:MAG: hypothetical protein ACI9QN_001977 [Arcticibacterium sp.]|jgi:hypothetical protein